jgi:hypothetical protein
MPFEKAIQSLSSLEEKLRRAFRLAGPIGARLVPDAVTPVVIAADLRTPGHANDEGRCWAWATIPIGTPAGISVLTVQFTRDVLVECAYITGVVGAGNSIELYVTTPTEAVPTAAPLVPEGTWRDRKLITTDAPPLLSHAAFAALAGTAVATSNRLQTWREGAHVNSLRPMETMIPAGGAVTFRGQAVNAALNCGLWGRVWP